MWLSNFTFENGSKLQSEVLYKNGYILNASYLIICYGSFSIERKNLSYRLNSFILLGSSSTAAYNLLINILVSCWLALMFKLLQRAKLISL